MSIKFKIQNTESKAEKEGDSFVRFSGVAEPFHRVSTRAASKVGIDAAGNPRLVFNTGLDENKVKFFKWYTEKEKEEISKQIKELKPIIIDYYGGPDVLAETNTFFWRDVRDVNRLSLDHELIDTYFDTENPSHALLYLSIISGAFDDLVSPTREWAERTHTQHYLALDTDEIIDEEFDQDITRSEAYGLLAEIRKEEGSDALFILAWCLQYDTNAFGAYLRSTPVRDMLNYHIKYIDGKLVTKKKRNMPKTFVDYATRWKGQQTKPALYVEAYIKAGEYYNYVQQIEGQYTTMDGKILGNTISEAVEFLMKPKSAKDLQALRDQVEAKWKE